MHHSKSHRLMKILVLILILTLTSLTLPQAYISESDVKLHLTSVLPQRFPVRHLPKPETKRSLEPHKPLDPNLSKDARSTRSVVPRLIH
ncbi:hypothetical protein AVEN_120522-1 [Araneus ventricosus]|uniref:Uncharacterized protein n=1 Tax=Araneus ventricosus TaxID=182803 RepID=A0A4Y2NY26_ARAVE|nr:hypothetical protein AVEN_120522-1 [Araneus ventricosus]